MKTWIRPDGPRTHAGFYIKSEPGNRGRNYWLGFAEGPHESTETRISNAAYKALKKGPELLHFRDREPR